MEYLAIGLILSIIVICNLKLALINLEIKYLSETAKLKLQVKNAEDKISILSSDLSSLRNFYLKDS